MWHSEKVDFPMFAPVLLYTSQHTHWDYLVKTDFHFDFPQDFPFFQQQMQTFETNTQNGRN